MDNKVKSIFYALATALGMEMKNAKTVTDIDGNDIVVETEGDITEGCKTEAADGAYKLPDGRTLIVKEHTIEKIELPSQQTDGNDGATDDPQNEGDGEGKTGEGDGNGEGDGKQDPANEPDPDEKDQKIAELEATIADLKKQLEEKEGAVADYAKKAGEFKAQKAKFDKIEAMINEAGGIDAVLKACSLEPSTKSKPADADDAYERFCNLAKLK